MTGTDWQVALDQVLLGGDEVEGGALAIISCLRWVPKVPPAGAAARIDWVGLVLVSAGAWRR